MSIGYTSRPKVILEMSERDIKVDYSDWLNDPSDDTIQEILGNSEYLESFKKEGIVRFGTKFDPMNFDFELRVRI